MELTAGAFLAVAPGSTGSLLISRVGPAQLHVFTPDLRLLGGVFTLGESDHVAVELRRSRGFWAFPPDHDLSRRFTELCEEPARDTLGSRLGRLVLFGALLDELFHFRSYSTPEAAMPDARQRLRDLLDRIPESELASCPMEDLAAQLRCSQRHLSRLFHEEYGMTFRARQQTLRLDRARQLLENSHEKVVQIALESGYQSLGLFNSLFKRRYGVTPGRWRARAAGKVKRPSRLARSVFALLLATGLTFGRGKVSAAEPPGAATNAPPIGAAQVAPEPGAPTLKFAVHAYRVAGNRLLSVEVLRDALLPYMGDQVTIETIQKAMGSLVLAYRERGYATVGVAFPEQTLSNATVQLMVTEGRLADIQVVNNHFFSSNNVMRALPGVRTNVLLIEKVFQAELDQANANRDRQIYPKIVPGPDPGTSALILKVQDRLPLHGRFDLDNQNTPDTPDLRINTSIEYDNLWQRENAIGLQYGFSPQEYKDRSLYPWCFMDLPLIANYGGYYRLPLGAPSALSEEISSSPQRFGYDEATHRFNLPPTTGVPELNVYGSRSTTDTGVKLGPRVLVAQTPVTTIWSQDSGQDLSITEAAGFRFNVPLPNLEDIHLSLSAGADLKYYWTRSYNTNNFITRSVIPGENPGDPPTIVEGTTSSAQPVRSYSLTYLPLTARLDAVCPDSKGSTAIGLGLSYNLSFDGLSDTRDFELATGSRSAKANFLVATASISRDQKIYGDWSVQVRADGQVSDTPLFTNEQYALGGLTSVRGYHMGEEYGDNGWRLSFEPRTPAINLGLVDARWPMLFRGAVFMDYGQTMFIDPRGRESPTRLWGVGTGVNLTVGEAVDIRLVLSVPLLGTIYTVAYNPRLDFSVAVQF